MPALWLTTMLVASLIFESINLTPLLSAKAASFPKCIWRHIALSTANNIYCESLSAVHSSSRYSHRKQPKKKNFTSRSLFFLKSYLKGSKLKKVYMSVTPVTQHFDTINSSSFETFVTVTSGNPILEVLYSVATCGKEFLSDDAGDGPHPDLPSLDTIENDLSTTTDSLHIAWNCNGHLAISGMDTVAMIIQHYNIDIFLLSDTRLDERSSRYREKQLRKLIPGSSILSFPTTRAFFNKSGGYRMNTMGGTMIVIAPRCAVRITDSGCNSSGLGIAAYVTLIINDMKLCVTSYYQPIGTDRSGTSTIYARLQHFLHKNNIPDNPLTFVSNTVSELQQSQSRKYAPVYTCDIHAKRSTKLLQYHTLL